MASIARFQIDINKWSFEIDILQQSESIIQMSLWNLSYVYLKANIRFYHKFQFDPTGHPIDFYTEKGFCWINEIKDNLTFQQQLKFYRLNPAWA